MKQICIIVFCLIRYRISILSFYLISINAIWTTHRECNLYESTNKVARKFAFNYLSGMFWRAGAHTTGQSRASRRIVMKFLTSPSALERSDAPRTAVFHADSSAFSALALKITSGSSGFIIGFPPRTGTRVGRCVSMVMSCVVGYAAAKFTVSRDVIRREKLRWQRGRRWRWWQ